MRQQNAPPPLSAMRIANVAERNAEPVTKQAKTFRARRRAKLSGVHSLADAMTPCARITPN